MRHLFISNFKSRHIRLILLIMCWLLLLEGFFHIPAVDKRLQPFEQEQLWYSPYVTDRINLAQANPDADIWFIGSSVVMRGVNPAWIDPLLNQADGQTHHSLNMGLPAMVNMDYLREYLTDVFLPIHQPRTMVVGVFPHLFAYLTKDFVARGGDLTRNDSNQPDRQVSWWLYQHFALYRYGQTLRYAFFQEMPEQVTSDSTGYLPIERSILDNADGLHMIEPLDTRNDILDENLVRLKTLRDFLQSRGIQMMLINFPVYTRLVEDYPGGPANFVEYQDKLSAFAQSEQIPYCDLHQAFWEQYGNPPHPEDFEDLYHLNQRGAQAAAPMIAQFVGQNLKSDSTSTLIKCEVTGG